jgi:small subunit ribosomal protein S18
MAAKPFFRRRKTCPFEGDNAPKIDYKDTRCCSATFPSAARSCPRRITAVGEEAA